MVAVVVPATLLARTKPRPLAKGHVGPVRWMGTLVGGASLTAGLTLVAETVRLFADVGEGTLAPWDPTQNIVVEGPYRYVRNPMISGVLFVLLGEAAIFGSGALLVWTSAFFLINAVYLPMSEEPGLEERFGERYRTYKRNVPRWIPRLSPWAPGSGRRPTS